MKKITEYLKSVLLYQHWYESGIHSGLLDYSKWKGWAVHANHHFTVDLRSMSFDGVIASIGGNRDLYNWVESMNVPTVFLMENSIELNAPCINTDNKAIGAMAADFFAKRNFRNFTVIYSNPQTPGPIFRDRIDGFSERVKSLKGNLFIKLWEDAPSRMQREKSDRATINFFKESLKDLPRPLAVFIVQDSAAIFLQIACMELGISIPDDLAIISVNNDPTICPFMPVPLSSIELGWKNIGTLAGSILERMMDGKKISKEPIIIPPSGVVERQSSSIIAVDDRRVSAAVSFIWQNLENDPSVEDICQAVGIDRRTLTTAFSKHLGRGIKEEVQQARIRKIKSLLLESDMSATTIAMKMNFSSEYYLYRFFKRHTGLTTKDYRKRNGFKTGYAFR